MKKLILTLVKEFLVVGKDQMKQVGYIAQEVKNDTMRRGGFTASQWVTCKHPRRPGALTEEMEWGQLGVLQAQQDSSTAFGIKASMRFEAQKQMVKVDCGRRYAAALLRSSRTVCRNYTTGDMVMYRVMQGADGSPGSEWSGPARVIGAEGDVVWLQHGAIPVASAMHLLRPASNPELLSWQVMTRDGEAGSQGLR